MKLPTKKDIEAMRVATLEKAKNATLSDKALMVIDSLLSECDDGRENSLLNKIYRIAHGCSPFTSCYNVHGDWRKETLIEYENIIAELESSTSKETEG
jgi:hypothetical protein